MALPEIEPSQLQFTEDECGSLIFKSGQGDKERQKCLLPASGLVLQQQTAHLIQGGEVVALPDLPVNSAVSSQEHGIVDLA